MPLYDYFVYYYLTSKQYITNWYNSIIIYFLGYKECIMFANNKSRQISFRLLTYILINKLINFISKLKDKIDIKADKVQITKITNEGEKTIILDREIMNKNSIIFDDILYKLNDAKPNDTLSKYILLNLDLVNDDHDMICLKNYILKYKDDEEQYHNMLQNILIFNNINYYNNSSISIKIIKDKKIISRNIPLKEVYKKHINYIINIE